MSKWKDSMVRRVNGATKKEYHPINLRIGRISF
jgi:hypothetical protein